MHRRRSDHCFVQLAFQHHGNLLIIDNPRPDRSLHRDQATFIRLSTSCPHHPLPSITEARYLKLFTDGRGSHSKFWWDGIRYPVFDRLILNPLLSITAIHLSSCSSTSSNVSFTSTKSPANSIAQGGIVLASYANTSMISMKKSGLSADPWCNPTFTSKYPVLPHIVFILVLVHLCMSCITFTYPSGIYPYQIIPTWSYLVLFPLYLSARDSIYFVRNFERVWARTTSSGSLFHGSTTLCV